MLCSHGLQASFSPSMYFYWPAHRLWPEVQPLLYHHWDLLRTNRQELVDKVQHEIQKETQPIPTTLAVKPVCYKLEDQGEHFGLSLDTEDFSPEELSVKQLGRRLTVSGKTEKKEDRKGSYSYRCQQFRQEFDLPLEVNPEAVTCYLAADGKLHIQAAKAPCAEDTERELTIKRSLEEKTQRSVCSHTDGGSTQDTEDKTH
ncbi:heat shock protein 30-like [Myripristis murdjan]|uniref:heat shock protein 30-like n=1 Tax=Myripristis murdjan TaxID=586833 RepID=UPI0011762E13|nr:heat shock protein 30-like [Myripristis murdjan]